MRNPATSEHPSSIAGHLPLLAMVIGVVVAILAANLWLLLLSALPIPLALVLECAFLGVFLWWAAGGGPPRALRTFRAESFRRVTLTPNQWAWGLLAALFFAITVHAALVLLFRFIPYPVAAFRQGYDLSFLPSHTLQWLVVIVAAASAAICEETAFRGFIQKPLESRYSLWLAVGISSLAFTALHLSKSWALAAMIPIVFGAGVLLGLLAHAAQSLVPGMIGHFVMDVGLFAYWWTGIAGQFRARPIFETGPDLAFVVAVCLLALSLALVVVAVRRLRRIAPAACA